MPVQPDISAAAIEAAVARITEITPMAPTTATLAREAIASALPHLLPGLFVAELFPGRDDSAIWIEVPDHPGDPVPLLVRAEANATLFDAIAALIPDRTGEDE